MQRREDMKYRVHFTDSYGQATIECDSTDNYNEVMSNLQSDPFAEDIWTEYYDPEEGWQA